MAICFWGMEDLDAWMVSQGWACLQEVFDHVRLSGRRRAVWVACCRFCKQAGGRLVMVCG